MKFVLTPLCVWQGESTCVEVRADKAQRYVPVGLLTHMCVSLWQEQYLGWQVLLDICHCKWTTPNKTHGNETGRKQTVSLQSCVDAVQRLESEIHIMLNDAKAQYIMDSFITHRIKKKRFREAGPLITSVYPSLITGRWVAGVWHC